jgi:hypothetical protein
MNDLALVWPILRDLTNPVRAGLVARWKRWPYRKRFFDDEI